MCHSENIYGDKHKKTAGCSQTVRVYYTTGGCSLMFFMFIALLWAKCSLLHQ